MGGGEQVAQPAEGPAGAVLDRRLGEVEVSGRGGDAEVVPVAQHHDGAVERCELGQSRHQRDAVGEVGDVGRRRGGVGAVLLGQLPDRELAAAAQSSLGEERVEQDPVAVGDRVVGGAEPAPSGEGLGERGLQQVLGGVG